jgi:hypothetical protein
MLSVGVQLTKQGIVAMDDAEYVEYPIPRYTKHVHAKNVNAENICFSESPEYPCYCCTRLKGHTGDHEAGTGKGKIIAKWHQSTKPILNTTGKTGISNLNIFDIAKSVAIENGMDWPSIRKELKMVRGKKFMAVLATHFDVR